MQSEILWITSSGQSTTQYTRHKFNASERWTFCRWKGSHHEGTKNLDPFSPSDNVGVGVGVGVCVCVGVGVDDGVGVGDGIGVDD